MIAPSGLMRGPGDLTNDRHGMGCPGTPTNGVEDAAIQDAGVRHGNDTTVILYGDNNNWLAAWAPWQMAQAASAGRSAALVDVRRPQRAKGAVSVPSVQLVTTAVLPPE